MINNNTEIIDWLKTKVEKSFAKDLDYKEVKAYLSCDRPYPDLIAECTKEDGSRNSIRFLVV